MSRRVTLQVETAPEPVDLEAWVRRYVALLIEADRAPAADVAPAPAAAVR